MRKTAGPIAARKLIGRQLRRLRDTAKVSQSKAAGVIGRSLDTIQRMEKGDSSISRSDLIVLCDHYGIDPALRERLLELQTLTRTRAGWMPASSTASLALLVELESTANVIEQYNHFFVPGLLQTKEYAHAVMRAVTPNTEPEVIEAETELRVSRSDRLFTGDEPPQVTVLVDEIALRRRVGDANVMGAQLQRLATPPAHCDLRVVPFDAGAHPGLVTFVVYGFGDEFLSPVAYVEGVGEGQVLFEEEENVARFQRYFARLRKLALGRKESKELIRTMAEEW